MYVWCVFVIGVLMIVVKLIDFFCFDWIKGDGLFLVIV